MPRFAQGATLFAILLVIDQLAKLASRSSLAAENLLAELPLISLVAEVNRGTVFGLGAVGGEALRWGTVGGTVLLLGLLFLGGRHAHRVEGLEGPGWWLAAAGLCGNLIDRLWHGGVVEYVHLRLAGQVLSLNLADLLLVLGVALILRDALVRMRSPRYTLLPLSDPPPPFPDLGVLPRGIDNVRIDVRLSPQFAAEAKRLIGSLLYQRLGHERYGAKPKPPTRQEFSEFRGVYAQLLTGVVRQAKRENRPHPVVLMQFSVMKFLYEETAREFDAQVGHLRGIISGGSMEAKGGRKMLLHEHIAMLAQNRKTIELEVRRQLAEETLQVEAGPGAKLRESLLGQRWVVDEALLFNPLLAAADPHDAQVAMRHYVLLGKRTSDWESLRRLEGYIEWLFDRAVPEPEHADTSGEDEQAWLAGSDWAARAARFGLGLEAAEFEHNPLSDVPANVDLLFNNTYLNEWMTEAQRNGDRATRQRLRAQQRLQRLALRRVRRVAQREGLLAWIVAAYEVVPVYREHYAKINPLQLVQYLASRGSQRAALGQLRQALKGAGQGASLKPLQRLKGRLARLGSRQVEHHVLNFVRDFLTYRRDLRNFYLTQGVLEQIRLLEEADEIRLSRVNNCLHELLSGHEDAPKRERIQGHTVVKADLRGSTTITRELLEKGLNPATHFDQNFFAPIRDTLRTFAAEKVFVEGDAIIAAVLEYGDDADTILSVARACSLARRVIGIAEAHNKMLATHDLPMLQVGIGIAYSGESPTYLFDGEQPIMISSAIGRSDRLSSSSWRLRQLAESRRTDARRVRVYELAPGHPLRGEKGEVHLRYNVNGIEVEAAAFEKLRNEIDMRLIELVQTGRSVPARFHIGKAADAHGALHLLVIRESPVRYYGLDGPGESTGDRFYEVICDPRLLRLVEQQVTAAPAASGLGSA